MMNLHNYRPAFSNRTMNHSFKTLGKPMHCELGQGSTTYSLSYNFDITDFDAINQQPSAKVTIVLTLGNGHESQVKEFIKLYRESELMKYTSNIILRFEEEPNRRIINSCKLNCEKVEVVTMNDQPIFDFLQSRGHDFSNMINGEETPFYVLTFDFRHMKRNYVFDLLLKHTVGEWKYCIQLFQNHPNIRSTGLFPTPDTKSNVNDFWYDTYWTKVVAGDPFHHLTVSEKLESLYSSKNSWFTSNYEIEDAYFVYDMSSSKEVEKDDDQQVMVSHRFSNRNDTPLFDPVYGNRGNGKTKVQVERTINDRRPMTSTSLSQEENISTTNEPVVVQIPSEEVREPSTPLTTTIGTEETSRQDNGNAMKCDGGVCQLKFGADIFSS